MPLGRLEYAGAVAICPNVYPTLWWSFLRFHGSYRYYRYAGGAVLNFFNQPNNQTVSTNHDLQYALMHVHFRVAFHGITLP